jgi:hypothetical protein
LALKPSAHIVRVAWFPVKSSWARGSNKKRIAEHGILKDPLRRGGAIHHQDGARGHQLRERGDGVGPTAKSGVVVKVGSGEFE